MRIRSAELRISCATCNAMLNNHYSGDDYLDADDVEAEVRASSRWATDEDPEGTCCNACQREQFMAEKADNERRERNQQPN